MTFTEKRLLYYQAELWNKQLRWGRNQIEVLVIAQAVSRRLPTTAARVRAQIRSCGICGGQSDAGAGFLRVLRFPLPTVTPPNTPQSSSIIRGWYIATYQVVSVSPHPKKFEKRVYRR
jgi:hypothetical protein